MNTLLTALVSITLSVAAQFSLKVGMSSVETKEALLQPFTLSNTLVIVTNRFVMSGFVLYGLGAVVWLGVLSRWEVSKAYPLVGFGFALTVLVGMLVGEQTTLLRVIGVALICTGVFLVGRS